MGGNLIKLMYQSHEQTIEEEFADYLNKHFSNAKGQIKRYPPVAVNVFTKPPLIKFDLKIKFTFPNDWDFKNLAGATIYESAYLHCTCEIDDNVKKFKCDKFIKKCIFKNVFLI